MDGNPRDNQGLDMFKQKLQKLETDDIDSQKQIPQHYKNMFHINNSILQYSYWWKKHKKS